MLDCVTMADEASHPIQPLAVTASGNKSIPESADDMDDSANDSTKRND